ncbi:MAG: hypothetical protein HWE07_10330 [Cytophagia bacterium]|nr:hypothetical protein [Cytophagia bacterium]
MLSACIPEPENPTIELNESSQLAQVREWFEANKTKLRLPDRGTNFRTESQELILPFFEKEPDWAQFHHYYFPDGREVFEVSLENATKYFPTSMLDSFPDRKVEDLVIQNIMFISHPTEHRFDPVIARYYPDGEGSIEDFENISYNSIPHLWSGSLEVFTYDEHFFVGFKFLEGVLDHSYQYETHEGDKKLDYSRYDMTCSPSYFPVGYTVCYEGECTTTIERYVAATSCSGSSLTTFSYTGFGGGGTTSGGTDGLGGTCSSCYDPPEVPEPDFKIVNKISFRQYPCLSSSVNNAIDEDFSNEIQKMILDIFGESEDFNIEIEAIELEKETDGFFNPGTVFEDGSFVNFTIVINTLLENSSKEYITATIYHEFLHSYMQYLDLPNIREDDKADHEEMASKYLIMLSNVLIDQYGIKKAHAEALAWGGLGGTDAFEKLGETQQNYFGLINSEYKDGKKGTICN